MRMVRWAIIASVVVVVGGAAYTYRAEVAQKLGFGTPANAASTASPAAAAQPPGRRGRANPAGPVPVVVTTVTPKAMPIIVEAVGTVQSIASIQLKTRIDSQIMKIHVEEGAWSRKATCCSNSTRARSRRSSVKSRRRSARIRPSSSKRSATRCAPAIC